MGSDQLIGLVIIINLKKVSELPDVGILGCRGKGYVRINLRLRNAMSKKSDGPEFMAVSTALCPGCKKPKNIDFHQASILTMMPVGTPLPPIVIMSFMRVNVYCMAKIAWAHN